ncbi:MAG: hypothetical protein NTX79_03360 [Candidatus Micrarchaeota archaeon]|nr:hypothetical protein [Candidatus Micrarchaeota archaeon]
MAKTILFGTIIALVLLSGVAFAGMTCAADAYRNSCAGCSFDASGKMNQTCYQEKKAGGIACVSTSHAIASAAYAAGKCPGIDACASQLQSCQSQEGSGNDKADCSEGGMGVCFALSDSCVDKAALDCGEKPPDCKAPAALILLVVGLAFTGFARKG